MKVRPLTKPAVGMLVFNGSSMCSIEKIDDDGDLFLHVHNGNYDCWYYPDRGEIVVKLPYRGKAIRKSDPFFQVTQLTAEEEHTWYLTFAGFGDLVAGREPVDLPEDDGVPF